MENIEKYCLFENCNANEAIEKIITNYENERLVFIVNKKYKILGTLSEGDIIRALLVNKNIDNIKVTSIMNKSFKFMLNKNQAEARKLVREVGYVPLGESAYAEALELVKGASIK